MRSSLSSSLSTAARTVSGRSVLGQLGAVLGDDVVVAFAQLLADRVHLAAQQHLALLLVEAVGDLVADLVLQLEVGERLARPPERELEARLDVDRLQQLDALLHRQVGRVRRRVGELARVVDAGEHVGDAARAAVLEDRLDDRAVLAGELAGAWRRRSGSSTGSTCTCSAPVRAGLAGADAGPADAADHEGAGAVGQVARALDLGDGADLWRNGRRPAGTSTSRLPACSAAAPARFASSVSSAIVTTICGSTTPCVRGSRGRSWVLVSDIVPVVTDRDRFPIPEVGFSAMRHR